jgi:hypothetical protein
MSKHVIEEVRKHATPFAYHVVKAIDGESLYELLFRAFIEYYQNTGRRGDLFLMPFSFGIETGTWEIGGRLVTGMPASCVKDGQVWVGENVRFRPIDVQLRDPLQKERDKVSTDPLAPFVYPEPVHKDSHHPDSWQRVVSDMEATRARWEEDFSGARSYLTVEARSGMTHKVQRERADLVLEFVEANPTLSMTECKDAFMKLHPAIAPLTRGSFASILKRARARKLREESGKV